MSSGSHQCYHPWDTSVSTSWDRSGYTSSLACYSIRENLTKSCVQIYSPNSKYEVLRVQNKQTHKSTQHIKLFTAVHFQDKKFRKNFFGILSCGLHHRKNNESRRFTFIFNKLLFFLLNYNKDIFDVLTL